MSNYPSIDDPVVLEAVLARTRNRSREYWLDVLARYENEKPDDIVLPGVPPNRLASRNTRVVRSIPVRCNRAKRRRPAPKTL